MRNVTCQNRGSHQQCPVIRYMPYQEEVQAIPEDQPFSYDAIRPFRLSRSVKQDPFETRFCQRYNIEERRQPLREILLLAKPK